MSKHMGQRIAAFTLAITIPLTGTSIAHANASETTTIPESLTATQAPQTVELAEDQREEINALLQELGYSSIPDNVVRLKEEDEVVKAFDEAGNEVEINPTRTTPRIQTYDAKDEIKRAVGACLGIDFFAEVGAWEAIESQVTDWNKAAKFVLRRVGAIAIISCGGGVFYEYIIK